MTPAEIVLECEKRDIQLRVNPIDKKLTATPRKAVPTDLLAEMQKIRPELVAYLEEMTRLEGELTIDDIAPPPPPEPSIPEKIIAKAKSLNIEIRLDHAHAEGMLKVITPWDNIASEVPEILKDMPGIDHVGRQRMPIPGELASLIQTHQQALTAYLRAPYMPAPPPEMSEDPAKRSIWERIALPDNLLPNAKDNQARVHKLLFGAGATTRAIKDQLDKVDRSLIAITLPRLRGKK